MAFYNPAMNYPRHNILVLCDWVNLLLAVAIVAVGAYRTWGIASDFINRMDIVVITAGGKSIVFLMYILGTSHLSSLKRYYSATTVFVMAIIDTLMWAAALGLTAYGMVQIPPTGTRETISYVLIAIVAVTFFYVLYLTYRQRQFVKAAKRDGGVQQVRRQSDLEGNKGYQ